MQCPNCGNTVPEGAEVCPSCSVAIVTVADVKKRKYTPTDILGGVPFLVIGAVLMVWCFILFMQSFGPAWEVLSNLPSVGGLKGLIWVVDDRFPSVPVVLEAFSNLMWCLGGLFLLLGGIFSLVKARGVNQAGAAVTLMLFGLCAELLGNVIIQQFMGWPELLVKLAVIVVCLIIIRLKLRARKKLRFQQQAAKAQAVQNAMDQAAAIAGARQNGSQPPPQA